VETSAPLFRCPRALSDLPGEARLIKFPPRLHRGPSPPHAHSRRASGRHASANPNGHFNRRLPRNVRGGSAPARILQLRERLCRGSWWRRGWTGCGSAEARRAPRRAVRGPGTGSPSVCGPLARRSFCSRNCGPNGLIRRAFFPRHVDFGPNVAKPRCFSLAFLDCIFAAAFRRDDPGVHPDDQPGRTATDQGGNADGAGRARVEGDGATRSTSSQGDIDQV